MQRTLAEYDPEFDELHKALSVKQPYATLITQGVKTIELRTKDTKYRGKVIICSTAKKHGTLPVGCTMCKVEIYGTKPVSELTKEEIRATGLSKDHPYWEKAKYAWLLKDAEPLIEFPVSGQLGLWNLVYTKDILLPKVKPDKKKDRMTFGTVTFLILLAAAFIFGIVSIFVF